MIPSSCPIGDMIVLSSLLIDVPDFPVRLFSQEGQVLHELHVEFVAGAEDSASGHVFESDFLLLFQEMHLVVVSGITVGSITAPHIMHLPSFFCFF